jgi:hypothetical protein
LPRLWGKGANYIAVMGNYDNGTNSEHHRVALEISNGDSHTEFWARPQRLADGNWYHVLVSFNQAECLPQMLINNVSQTVKEKYSWCEKSNRQMKVNTKPVMIGNTGSFLRPAAGRIRDVAFYNRVLSSAERDLVYQGNYAHPGLLYHLPMCNSACTTVPDVSGNGFNGIPTNVEW